ncbi:MAG: Cof-type HAD-IIB family hydrolase [Clostridiaceae bacterium]|nr:Cof-type HAD-IIB family hydrolase [Clostridiaceae bacterium]
MSSYYQKEQNGCAATDSPEPALVFFDIDGTLVGNRPEPPDSAVDAIRRLRRGGHLAFINTGRPLSTVTRSLLQIGFDGVVASCGAYVSYAGQELLNRTIDPAILAVVLPALCEAKIDFWLEGRDQVYISDYRPGGSMEQVIGWLKQADARISAWHEPHLEANKISFQLCGDSDYERCRPILEQHFQIIRHNQENGELLLPGLTKASGIQLLLEHLHLPQSNTYAFGDSLNDLDMLTYVHYGIAMGNSRGQVRRISDHSTASQEEDGILLGLRHYNLIE